MTTTSELETRFATFVEHHVLRGERLPLDRLCEGRPDLAAPLGALVDRYLALTVTLDGSTDTPIRAPADAAPLPQFDGFQTIERIGAGGMGEVLSIAGRPDEDAWDNRVVLQMTARQTQLNFTPGEEYLYSNTGYTLLATIVERTRCRPMSCAAIASHPKVGASWEGFALEAVVSRLDARPEECFFWATHQGAELDLLVVRGARRIGFEFKRTTAPSVTRSMRTAQEDLHLSELSVVHAGTRSGNLAAGICSVAFSRLLDDLEPLH